MAALGDSNPETELRGGKISPRPAYNFVIAINHAPGSAGAPADGAQAGQPSGPSGSGNRSPLPMKVTGRYRSQPKPGPLEPGELAEVYQAIGMIAVQLNVSLEEASVRLWARAFGSGADLGELADDVVSRRLRFDPDLEPESHSEPDPEPLD
jgi:hypothetical protein